jgi:hypothetical protein
LPASLSKIVAGNIGREFAAFLRRMIQDVESKRYFNVKLHHNLNMAEKHLGFAAVRSWVINREPQTMAKVREPSLQALAGGWLMQKDQPE